MTMFQSTFPRRERRDHLVIIASPWGFNPRSREGNDKKSYKGDPDRDRFNPRSREGNDVYEVTRDRYTGVSIHVPAKGTTAIRSATSCRTMWCQSTFPRRERLDVIDAASRFFQFQSTFPRRERQTNAFNAEEAQKFQSTFPRRERQSHMVFKPSSLLSFQSTFPRRERPS